MATAGYTTGNARTQPELYIGNVPRGVKSKELRDLLAARGIQVLRCQIKKPKSRRPFAFVRVASDVDFQKSLTAAPSLKLRGLQLNVQKSTRGGGGTLMTTASNLEIQTLLSFSIGAYFLKTSDFLQRWCSLESADIQGSVKCTVNFEKEDIHLRFKTPGYEYKVQFFFRDMEYFLYFGSNEAPRAAAAQSSASYGLVLAFQNAPLVFREDRDPAENVSIEALLGIGSEDVDLLLRLHVNLSAGADEDADDSDDYLDDGDVIDDDYLWGGNYDDPWDDGLDDFLFVDGDVDEERNWRRTTGTFTDDPSIQGQYFHYLLTPESEQIFEPLMKRLREKYDAYEIYDESAAIKQPEVADLLPRQFYNKFAERHPFHLMFLVERMVSYGLLYRELLSELFFDLLGGESTAYQALRHYEQSYCHDLDSHGLVMAQPVEDLLAASTLVHAGRSVGRSLEDDRRTDCSTGDHVMVHHATITPLVVHCYGPYLDTPNRVLRKYSRLADRFLRVHFADEHHEKLKVGTEAKPLTEVTDFIQKTLREGIDVAGRHYEFLAMSNSQLRENSCWFFASEKRRRRGVGGGEAVTADDIRAWMGDFSAIKNVAKFAARMGQCFSCTNTSGRLLVSKDEFEEIADVKTADNKYTFSDGIGMISSSFAKEATSAVPNHRGRLPSAFQIRFAGYKGMVTVSPNMEPHLKLKLRPSMRKFQSDHLQLEIIQASCLLPGHLNRQIILLLATLGVKERVFIDLQKRMTSQLDDCVCSEKVGMQFLAHEHCVRDVGAPTTLLHSMLKSGFRFGGTAHVLTEPFMEAMMLAYRNCRLAQLEDKARILVEKAACLHGVLDESGHLDYGEVHVRIRDSEGRLAVVTGPVVVAKNPCLHPGDVRVLVAMAAPEPDGDDRSGGGHRDADGRHSLELLENCLVFPRRGERPHPDECSGSDLDGDTYFVTWDQNLVPPRTQKPMEYEGKSAAEVDSVTLDHIYDFFTKYMQNDALGAICNAHVAQADLSDQDANDPICLELAKMQSDAVDYPKTGVPVEFKPTKHAPPTYPDFMKKRDKPQHMSKKVLGRLFHDINVFRPRRPRPGQPAGSYGHGSADHLMIEQHRKCYDADLCVPGFEEFCQEAILCKTDYDSSLRNIMKKYQLRKEEEAVGGFFVKLPRSQRRRSLHDVQLKVRQEATRLRQHYLADEFDDVPLKYRGNEEEYRRRKSSAWYIITYHAKYAPPVPRHYPREGSRPELVSFAWIPFRHLCAIKEEKLVARSRRPPHS